MADFLRDCLADFSQKVKQQVTPKDFRDTFCARCRNPDCQNAGWSRDLFGQRVSTQEERLLRPLRADPHLPKYAHIIAQDFPNMIREAMRLEISDRRGDWTVPEPDIAINDGEPLPAKPASTETVDNAVRNLARAQGRDAPSLPVQEPDTGELAHSAREMLGDITVTTDEDEDEAAPSLAAEPSPILPPAPQHPKRAQPAPRPVNRNTPAPKGGVMIDGSAPKPKEPAPDPWSAPTTPVKRVTPGATVKLGQSGEIVDE